MLLIAIATLESFSKNERSNLESMNWVDVLIVAIAIVAAIRGWFQGAIRQVLGWIGLIAGFYVGIAIAPSLSTKITHASWRPVLALVIVVVAAYAGHFGGHILGSAIRRTVKMVKLGLVDSGAGVVVGVAGALITVLAGRGSPRRDAVGDRGERDPGLAHRQGARQCPADGSLGRGPPADVAPQRQLPERVRQHRLADDSVDRSAAETRRGTRLSPRSPSDIVKVLAMGCPDTHQGTGFFIAPAPRGDQRARGGGRDERHGRRNAPRRWRSSIRSMTSRCCGFRRRRCRPR